VSGPVQNVGTLLGVWAHPDDEAYASAGLMSLARANGNRVVVATATRGEQGTPDPDIWPPHRLAAIREREMRASLAALDVREHRFLGYTDGTLSDVPSKRAVEQIVDLIYEIRPDTIVTFGPDGLTGHDDHRSVSRWVRTAWHRTGRRARLWYATFTPEFHDHWHDVNRDVGLWMPGAQPPSHESSDLAFALRCDETMLDQKMVALRAHASQTLPIVERMGIHRYRRWWSTEAFVAAAPAARPAADQEAAACPARGGSPWRGPACRSWTRLPA
jgi:LmbE family N-acetylglucosaminyl deacetylase